MIVIPAIDLRDGKCVRLLQGRSEDMTVYSDDPVSTALRWQSMGATLIHIVDLDGAFSGSQKNIDSIIRIRQAVGAKLQLGGGIRDLKTIERLFGLGIDRVILGTVAIENPSIVEEASREFPDRILVGIDAKNSLVAVKGWVEVRGLRHKGGRTCKEDGGAWGSRDYLYRYSKRWNAQWTKHRGYSGDSLLCKYPCYSLRRGLFNRGYKEAKRDKRALGCYNRKGYLYRITQS